jgi:hypothetical protein
MVWIWSYLHLDNDNENHSQHWCMITECLFLLAYNRHYVNYDKAPMLLALQGPYQHLLNERSFTAEY